MLDSPVVPATAEGDTPSPAAASANPVAAPPAGAPRRSIAVISHPDAGKSTLTEALALHARAITQAGAVHGKGNRAGVVSDWLEMEQKRGISITSAALQFEVDGVVINLLDTPGHADFSEDTYRVLTAVDAAVMLLDAAKGLEPQTLKLFAVCRRRGIPVITFVNKWDRPGREALELVDELENRIQLRATPVTWPVGDAGDLQGLLDVRHPDDVMAYRRAPGGATLAEEERLTVEQARERWPDRLDHAADSMGLLPELDMPSFLAGETTPLLFGAALTNIGVRQLLEVVTTLAPPPGPREDVRGTPRPVEAPFSGVVFKMQAGMDPNHRDHVAFLRVNSGVFRRGGVYTHAQTGRPFATKYAASVFGRERETIEEAYPGDVVGLVNATSLSVGDTLHDPDGPAVEFPPLPVFAPEHFLAARVADPGRSKQFRKGVAQLEQEGVVQVLISEARGDGQPILAAVGPLQFEVASFRMENEFRAPIRTEPLGYSVARLASDRDAELLAGVSGVELAHRTDGVRLALFRDVWRLRGLQRDRPELELAPLLADAAD
ncbi:peptide chain release factor 3 [Actinotalea ferrariae CF5-4]|uniref:Peptide chain release factor 3 n=1 Tax=Actinotalea ferrariae CF5-4 TaxID=948458 RepID=A0A021VVJ4_9CELL|nr:peptide chain release factor 3 [Actinotalea ferrariae]EYR65138.1 peptide chain release factor 3 [Actinotalea ferrariae CF5-4]